jgi:zinc transporter ZupT
MQELKKESLWQIPLIIALGVGVCSYLLEYLAAPIMEGATINLLLPIALGIVAFGISYLTLWQYSKKI